MAGNGCVWPALDAGAASLATRIRLDAWPVQDGAAVQAELEVDGQRWQVTCVSMGNPHALVYSNGDRREIKARAPAAPWPCSARCRAREARLAAPAPV